jgi:hypothetical protein
LCFFYFSRAKSELAIRRLEKCLCFTLASLNYYEDVLHKFSILLAYFPLATGGFTFDITIECIRKHLFVYLDPINVVHLGFEDSTINADEVSYENHELEDNETNRYIELLK